MLMACRGGKLGISPFPHIFRGRKQNGRKEGNIPNINNKNWMCF
jgi:hypothetical protein